MWRRTGDFGLVVVPTQFCQTGVDLLWRRRKLLVPLDDLVDRVQEIFFCDGLPPPSNGEHTGLRAHGSDAG